MDNRERRSVLIRAMDTIVEIPYIKDDVNAMIDDAYNLLEETVEMLTTILDEEEN